MIALGFASLLGLVLARVRLNLLRRETALLTAGRPGPMPVLALVPMMAAGVLPLAVAAALAVTLSGEAAIAALVAYASGRLALVIVDALRWKRAEP
jgi:hypothetical protein